MLLLASLLILAGILVTKIGSKLGAPSLLLFLILGMVAGADGLGFVFEHYESAEAIGHFAMSVILFTAGMETRWDETRPIFKQSLALSILGVLFTMLLTGVFIYFVLGKLIGGVASTLLGCLLIGAIVSSTDSTSVFSILHGKRLHLRENLGPMLELESGSNDPMANILTIVLVGAFSATSSSGVWPAVGNGLLTLFLQLAVGFAVGVGIGYAGKWLMEHIHLDNSSLYAILILSVCFIANSLSVLLHGNGLLAVYVAALFIGNKAKLDYRRDVMKFFDGITWMMQLVMFLMLGLLARPSSMLQVLLPAVLIGLFLLLVARPVSVFLCLWPFRGTSAKAKTLVSWVGMKGAGPILCALFPVVAGLEGASVIFNIVFLISLVSLVLQGFSFPPLAKALNLSYDADPDVDTLGIDIPEEMGMLRDHIVTEDDLASGDTIHDLHLPHGIHVVMVSRDGQFLVPHGSMKLQVGDKLVIILGDSDD